MFACIFIPDFSVQAIIRFEPELRARSVAVLTGRPPLEKVVARNSGSKRMIACTEKSGMKMQANMGHQKKFSVPCSQFSDLNFLFSSFNA